MRGLTRDTINEVLDRKVIWIFVGLVVLSILVALGISTSDVRIRIDQSGPGGTGSQTLNSLAFSMINGFMAVLIFVAAMVSASSLPSMLGRGRSDFYLSKPLSRGRLFLGKLIGMLSVYGLIVLACSLIIYVAIAAAVSSFDLRVLYIMAFNIAELSVWLVIIAWAGIFSNSTTVSIVTAFLVWIVQTILLQRAAIEAILNSSTLGYILDIAYWVVPKTTELSRAGVALAGGQPVENWLGIAATAGFALLTALASIWIFNRKQL